uniref:Movement protein n=1 Tax=Gongylonema pulchrum TaxID=637853 RepID=A0A183D3K1_9BILA
LFQIAARSALFYNYGTTSRSGKGLYLFHKPQWTSSEIRIMNKKKEIYAAFPLQSHGDLLSLTLPMIRIIRPQKLDCCQYKVLMSMDSTACCSSPVGVGFNPRVKQTFPTVVDEEEEFEIEEIDI